ncbi:MAG: hypothetical protein ACE5HK_01300 [Candidatus Methylomirabilales bacterium]
MGSVKRNFLVVVWALLLLGPLAAHAQEIRYFYDDLGWLIGVGDQQGNAAGDVYDAVGDIRLSGPHERLSVLTP